MLTQMELSSTSDLLDDITESSLDRNEMEYFKSQFESSLDSAGNTLNDFVKSQQEMLESISTPSTTSEDSPPYHLSFYDSSNSSDATSLIYDSDELKPFAKDFSSFNGLITLGSFDITSPVGIDAILDNKPVTTKTFELEGGVKYEFDVKYELDSSSMYSPPPSDAGSPRSNNPFDCSSSDIPAALRLKPEEHDIMAIIRAPPGATYKDTSGCSGGNGKGKISLLQKRALDTVFTITEQPSRGLVLNIAQELGLHHVTVKNFFSNGRRRLRRAAARVLDPEKTQRENQKRKEKRRLASMAAAVNNINNANNHKRVEVTSSSVVQKCVSSSSQSNITDTNTLKEPSQISPQRRALMEKLANKVQRNVAQKSTQGVSPDLCQSDVRLVTTSPLEMNSTQFKFTSNMELDQLTNLSSATIDALAESQLDFDINALDATILDTTHLDLQALLELHPPSSLDLNEPLGTSIDAPYTGVNTSIPVVDSPMSEIDFKAIADMDLMQNTTTELLEVPQDPDPWAFF